MSGAGGFTTDQASKSPSEAYPISQREAHAEQHILLASEAGFLNLTSCTHICRAYGIPDFTSRLKSMKARLFPEFACNGEGK